jgi:type I restriction enzyme M protein
MATSIPENTKSVRIKFAEVKDRFDFEQKNARTLERSLVWVDGKIKEKIQIRNEKNQVLEEYYKWQFIYGLISSGLYSKDHVGVEIYFPKGNINSAPIKIDGCIFDSAEWINHYNKWRAEKNFDSVEWLRKHLIAVIEFKRGDNNNIKKVFTSQLKPALKESESNYCLGFYYDNQRLHIFQKTDSIIVRYDESRNQKGHSSSVNELSLDITDGYYLIPSFDELLKQVNKASGLDRSKRLVDDLDIITGVHSLQINNAISQIVKTLDKVGLFDQRGYKILIQVLAMKICDEKRSEEYKQFLSFYATQPEMEKFHLLFYINKTEKSYVRLSDENIQEFIKRMQKLHDAAALKYDVLLHSDVISWKNENYIKAVSSMVEYLQDYSFIRSYKTDLYQLVFYRFANEFAKAQKSQFITPLQIIDFLVNIVNPKNGESIIDPTVGIADFLSLAYVNAHGKLDDKNIYGVDNDEQMVMLAQLNMLLNGDGNTTIKYAPDKGSILYKFNTKKELVELDPKTHKKGRWDNWADETKLMKFNVVLTNPPFGEDRKFEPKDQREQEIAELYELWDRARVGGWIDLGLVFLENAYRILDKNGRMGIVISNSLASIERWKDARDWLRENMRIVALFDLPSNVFADSGVNTTLIIAYKPDKEELEKLKKDNYQVFIRNIDNIGYEIRTQKRVKYYNPIYKFDENFNVEIDAEGNSLLNEDFTKIIHEFKEWAMTQEKTLRDLFIG